MLDAALVGAADDAEVAVLSPVRVPAVGDLPVVLAGLGVSSPPDDPNSVPTDGFVGGVLVDAAGVVLEVGVDGEGNLDGATGHDGVLDGGHVVGVDLDLSLEAVLVRLVVAVGVGSNVVAGGGTPGGGLRFAPGITLRRVRVSAVALRP